LYLLKFGRSRIQYRQYEKRLKSGSLCAACVYDFHMNAKLNLALSLAAGLLGGVFTHYVWPAPVHAQAPSGIVGGAQTLQLPVFVLNESGAVAASLTMDSDGQPNFKLFDAKPSAPGGDETLRVPSVIWSARGAAVEKR
jgi:hypothetical protein